MAMDLIGGRCEHARVVYMLNGEKIVSTLFKRNDRAIFRCKGTANNIDGSFYSTIFDWDENSHIVTYSSLETVQS